MEYCPKKIRLTSGKKNLANAGNVLGDINKNITLNA
jgi:hypothetical protein